MEHASGIGSVVSASAAGEAWQESRREGLDLAQGALSRGEVSQGMQGLLAGLERVRAALLPDDWRCYCQRVCTAHPLQQLLLQDPLTRKSLTRPHGDTGDAELIGLLDQELDEEHAYLSRLGLEIYRHLYGQPNAVSLRGRRAVLAQWIDSVAEQVRAPRILSVACGHLHEARDSRAVQEHRLGCLLALDQDIQSLAVVGRELLHLGVAPVLGSVRALLRRGLRFDHLDGIYAAGLYDYLDQPAAISLTRLLFSMLRPGGRLLLANHAESLSHLGCTAYMEAFMGWWWHYRQESEVESWARDIPRWELERYRLFEDEPGHLIYLELIHR